MRKIEQQMAISVLTIGNRRINMAESMKGLNRSHRCTEVSKTNIGETITVMGWVQKAETKVELFSWI